MEHLNVIFGIQIKKAIYRYLNVICGIQIKKDTIIQINLNQSLHVESLYMYLPKNYTGLWQDNLKQRVHRHNHTYKQVHLLMHRGKFIDLHTNRDLAEVLNVDITMASSC